MVDRDPPAPVIPVSSLRKKLAPVYAPLFPDVFDRPEIVETRATCDSCVMCNHGEIAPVAMDYFKPDAKCCTYHPGLANYLVGAILADQSEELAEGRRRLRARIAARIGVTPRMIQASRKYNLIYAAARRGDSFGRAKALLCPYFDEAGGGRCTVWLYREAVCSTYFCKYSAGKPGFEFWDAMKGYLSLVEQRLCHFAANSIDPTLTEPTYERTMLTHEDVQDLPPKDADYASYWGAWVGREEEFYIACYEKVRALPRSEFEKNVDETPEGRGFLARLEAKYDRVADPIPPRSLIRTKTMKSRVTDDAVVVTTYNAFDAFSLEKELFEVLGKLREDQTLEENLARLDREEDIQLAPELIQYLFVHGVLSEPEKATPEEPKPMAPPLSPILTTRDQRRRARKLRTKR